jgi:Arc/MetJ family transcription regulator
MQTILPYDLHQEVGVMRTTLNLDEEALAGAMKVSPGKTRTDVINEALREYSRRRRLRGFLELEGKLPWEGDLDALRKRREGA